MLDLSRWNGLLAKYCNGTNPAPWFHELIKAYRQSHRRYHGIDHIAHCLKELDAAPALADQPDVVELALWLHDVVYDPKAEDNEARSAEWAVRMLAALAAPKHIADNVQALILATRHNGTLHHSDARLIVDIDLSTLGQPPEVYDIYEAAIRAEYAWMPGHVFRQKRWEVLGEFIQRPRIYYLRYFFERYEAQARANINRTLAKL